MFYMAAAALGFTMALVCPKHFGNDKYRVKYYASLIESLEAVNSKSDFTVAASTIEELRSALRTGKVTSDELQGNLPKAHLTAGWVRVYELMVDEYRVEALLEKIEDLSKKKIHEEGDYALAMSLSKEAIRLHELILKSRLLIPRFKVDKALLQKQVESTRIANNAVLPSKTKRR